MIRISGGQPGSPLWNELKPVCQRLRVSSLLGDDIRFERIQPFDGFCQVRVPAPLHGDLQSAPALKVQIVVPQCQLVHGL